MKNKGTTTVMRILVGMVFIVYGFLLFFGVLPYIAREVHIVTLLGVGYIIAALV